MGSCQIETLKKIGEEKDYSKGYFLLSSQPKCSYCDARRELLETSVKNIRPIVEASLEDMSCGRLADSFEIEITPTVLCMQNGEGEESNRPRGENNLAGRRVPDIYASPAAAARLIDIFSISSFILSVARFK